MGKPVIAIALAAASALFLAMSGGRAPSQTQNGSERRPLLHAPFDVTSYFVPSGYMGDGKDKSKRWFEVNSAFRDKPRKGDADGLCIKISYKRGPESWAGVYWQYPDGNWGDKPGRTVTGATRIVFWAAGENGDEVAVFKSGGIDSDKRYRDSYEVSAGTIRLTKEWAPHEISLKDQDLSNVIGAFACTVSADANPTGAVIYIDDIRFE